MSERTRWRRRKDTIWNAAEAYELVRGTTVVAVASIDRRTGHWYAYGLAGYKFNTHGTPYTLDEAKKRAREIVDAQATPAPSQAGEAER